MIDPGAVAVERDAGPPEDAASLPPAPAATPAPAPTLAPAATPAPILAEIEKQVLAGLRSPEIKKVSDAYSLQLTMRGSQDFRRDFEAADPVVARMIEASGAKQE